MRKKNKIKASLIFLSWLMIMAHNIIPHNHQYDEFFSVPLNSDTGVSTNYEYHNHNNDHNVCRISTLLFHHLTQDNFFIETCSNDHSSPEIRKELIIDNNKYSLYHKSYYASVSLRAPPAA